MPSARGLSGAPTLWWNCSRPVHDATSGSPNCSLWPNSRGLDVQFVDAGRLNALAQSDEHQGVVALVESSGEGVGEADFDSVLAASLARRAADVSCCLTRFRIRTISAPASAARMLWGRRRDTAEAWLRPLSAVALKAASGATETTPFATSTIWCSASRPLQAEGHLGAGAEMETDATLFNTALTGPIAWVMGNEGKGCAG